MSAAATAAGTFDAGVLGDGQQTGRSAERLFDGGGESLEDRVLGTWEDLAARGHAECLVCHGPMLHPGRCRRCGSELS